MKKNILKESGLEDRICKYSSREGVGSIYERVIVKRFFERLMKAYLFNSVLEYKNISITKGLDNIIFLEAGKRVTVGDEKLIQHVDNWPHRKRPAFVNSDKLRGRFNLVWNFGLAQLKPEIFDEMIKRSDKYLLLFVPNFVNCGMPVHLFYHKLTRTICKHPERGSIKLRCLGGIKRLVESKGLIILKAGYIDVPLLPDIGFSMRELKHTLKLKSEKTDKDNPIDSVKTLKIIKKLGFLEEKPIPGLIKQFFAHHIYVFAKIT